MPCCYNCGKEVSEEDSFCPRCGAPLKEEARAGVTTYEVDMPYPETPSARLEIVVGAPGRVNVEGGAEKFVEGTIEYDVPEWEPKVEAEGDRVKIAQLERVWDRSILRVRPENRWSLKIGGEKPFSLGIKSSVGRARWELGGLPITEMRVESGVSENHISFKGKNPEVMERLELTAGVGDVSLTGLLDANFGEMKVSGAVGEVELRFTGERLGQDAKVRVEGGVGSFNVLVDRRVPARASVRGLTGVRARGDFQRRRGGFPSGGEYTNEAYERGESPHLEFDITMGVGGITLESS